MLTHHYLELTSVISYFIHPQLKDQQGCQGSVCSLLLKVARLGCKDNRITG